MVIVVHQTVSFSFFMYIESSKIQLCGKTSVARILQVILFSFWSSSYSKVSQSPSFWSVQSHNDDVTGMLRGRLMRLTICPSLQQPLPNISKESKCVLAESCYAVPHLILTATQRYQ